MLPIIKNILYVTDLSDCALHALHYAASLGQAYRADVTVMHVVPDTLEYMSEQAGTDMKQGLDQNGLNEFAAPEMAEAHAVLEKRVRDITNECVAAMEGQTGDSPFSEDRIIVAQGDASERILSEAQSGKYDMVVMGTHGQSTFMDLVLGSVARHTTTHSPIPVLVVRLPDPR